jgi:translation initiation factor IF-2
LELVKTYQNVLKTEILDIMEYLPKDDIELFLLEKGVNFEFLEHKSEKVKRPMIVTIMGHVDHGKTTLLDTLRNSNVVDSEYGKITQSIGAFNIKLKDNTEITFIDTPGHEAFTKMRQRGAKTTDCVVLVVSAIEGVQNQTKEVIDIIFQSQIPVIVALNKIDRDQADPDRVYNELKNYGVVVKKLGGTVPSVEISARKKINIDKLEQELHEMTKNVNLEEEVNIPAQAFIIESKTSRGQTFVNPIAALIVKKGILREGDAFICGDSYGKIKSINNDKKEQLKEAFPGMAVEVLGFKIVPQSGTILTKLDDIKDAQHIIENREKLRLLNEAKQKANIGKGFKLGKLKNKRERHRLMRKGDKQYLEQKIESKLAAEEEGEIDEQKLREIYLLQGNTKKKIIINTDTIGILESIYDELQRDFDEKVINDVIIDSTLGGLTEEDFRFANSSNSVIFAFNLEQEVGAWVETYKVGLRKHKLIYTIVEEIKYYIQEANLLDTTLENPMIKGRAVVKDIFKIKHNNKPTQIAGLEVISGEITQNGRYRIIRKKNVEKLGLKVGSLKQNKESVSKVLEGDECGLILEDFEDFKVGDFLDCYTVDSKKEGITNTRTIVECY